LGFDFGDIGSGKSFTKEMILSQVLTNQDREVIIFDPLLDADFYSASSSERVSQFTEAADMDVLVDSFVEYVEDRIENSDLDIYVIIDEASYVVDTVPEKFEGRVESSHGDEIEMLVTSFQTIDSEFMFENVAYGPLWLLHRSSSITSKVQDQLGVSERVEQLRVGTSAPYSEAILKEKKRARVWFAL
jgi:hypothetical protein